MAQSLQPKGHAFESTCVFLYLYSTRLSSLIIDVPRPLTNDIWIILFQWLQGTLSHFFFVFMDCFHIGRQTKSFSCMYGLF